MLTTSLVAVTVMVVIVVVVAVVEVAADETKCELHAACDTCNADEYCAWCNVQDRSGNQSPGPCIPANGFCPSGNKVPEWDRTLEACLSTQCADVYECGYPDRGECIGHNLCKCKEGYVQDHDVGCAYVGIEPGPPIGLTVVLPVVLVVLLLCCIVGVVVYFVRRGHSTAIYARFDRA
mmetsp:Transcript_53752/g.131738  ORF Transcript_53752/g.131738 Transcript_53752/m.131738 type:complete len:178 (+) Transcript_53752:71-604(+)